MDLRRAAGILGLLLVFCTCSGVSAVDDGSPCSIRVLFSCKSGEVCVQRSPSSDVGTCRCRDGFERIAGKCTAAPVVPGHTTNIPPTAEPHTSTSSKNAVVAGVLVPLLLLGALLAGVVYLGRRFNWLHRLRQLRPQRTNDVLIGRPDDDDDPIA